MENASANADPDAHVPQLASGGEDGIFGTSGPEQYRYSTDAVCAWYIAPKLCVLRVKLTSNGQVTGLGPPGVTFAISGFKRAKIGGEGKSRLVELICDHKMTKLGSIGSRRGPCMKVWQYKLLWKGNVTKTSEQQNIISTLSNLIWSLFTGEHYLE